MPSYLYFIDSRLTTNQKTEETLIGLEKNTVELGINGPIIRLNPLKSIRDALESRVSQGVQTIVGVGGDSLFFDLLDFVCDKTISLGMIALNDAPILKKLGIPYGLAGCRTIAQRIVRLIDCGKINQKYFFSSTAVPADFQVVLDRRFSLRVEPDHRVLNQNMRLSVVNIDFNQTPPHQSGRLRLQIVSESKKLFGAKTQTAGSFSFTELKITGQSDNPIVADGQKSFKPPVEIIAAPKALKMIVGKARHQIFQ